jgi:hypothetical protein
MARVRTSAVLWSGLGPWVATSYGLERRDPPQYFIRKDRLWEPHWAEHIGQKSWSAGQRAHFEEALTQAKQHHARHRPKVAA